MHARFLSKIENETDLQYFQEDAQDEYSVETSSFKKAELEVSYIFGYLAHASCIDMGSTDSMSESTYSKSYSCSLNFKSP
jgi:hypothetical protein